ncbi:DUF4839 domain-containing protein [Nocardioides cavernae]|uniref:DUF4839 domain-containing protein n=1 Tax=Nocardioides cavernae TaxID=1921566 RepID=A0ABR8NG62_9ACTN|nr:DUF4839 domain-containing protein [Nocardioides cavernae]MBD3926572.1 DUF4839 domain-containing protein [Nocardioides cavernae]MBM7512291.1 hypothetical protein [Nocardioides cavernae]
MRRFALALTAISAIGFTSGCSGEPVDMPDVVGMKLDDAQKAVEKAGFDDDVQVEGGGVFGIVVESNWTVCSQEPAVGSEVSDPPSLTVERDCGGDDAEGGRENSSSEDQEDTEDAQTEAPSESSAPVADQDLTVKNSPDLRALLASGNQAFDAHRAFATKHKGETIVFDGAVGLILPHGDYSTRFDYALYPGDYDGPHTQGPTFAFIDVNYYDFGLIGKKIPDSVDEGKNFRFTATVKGFQKRGGFIELDPVATEAR